MLETSNKIQRNFTVEIKAIFLLRSKCFSYWWAITCNNVNAKILNKIRTINSVIKIAQKPQQLIDGHWRNRNGTAIRPEFILMYGNASEIIQMQIALLNAVEKAQYLLFKFIF